MKKIWYIALKEVRDFLVDKGDLSFSLVLPILIFALMGHPQMIFMDEPTVGIDPQSRNNIFETIEGLRARGMTILYTTHYMEEADHLCRRVAIMDGGKIIALDTPKALKSQIGDPDHISLEQVFLKLTGRSLRD